MGFWLSTAMSARTFQAALVHAQPGPTASVICSDWPHPSFPGDAWLKLTSRAVLKREGSSGDPPQDDTHGSEKRMTLPGAQVGSQLPGSKHSPLGTGWCTPKPGLAPSPTAPPRWIALPSSPCPLADRWGCYSTATASFKRIRASLLFPVKAHTQQVLIHGHPWRPSPRSPH